MEAGDSSSWTGAGTFRAGHRLRSLVVGRHKEHGLLRSGRRLLRSGRGLVVRRGQLVHRRRGRRRGGGGRRGHSGVGGVELAQPLGCVADALRVPSIQQGLHCPFCGLGSAVAVAQGVADVPDPLEGVRVLGVGLEDLLDVLERLLVEPVLQVNIGLGEDPGERAGLGRLRRRGRARNLGGSRPSLRGTGSEGAGRRGGLRGSRIRGCRGRGLRRAAGGQLLDRLGVVREELLDHAPGDRRLLAPTPLGVDARQRTVDGDGLGHLPEIAERLRHEAKRVHVLLVGAVADLELAEGLLRVAAGQVLLGQLLRQRQVVGSELEDLAPPASRTRRPACSRAGGPRPGGRARGPPGCGWPWRTGRRDAGR